MDKPAVNGFRANVTLDQRALLEKRIRGEIPSRNSSSQIPRRADQRTAPLSLTQSGQWMLQQLQPGNTILHIFKAVYVSRPIDQDILELVLTEISRRHDILRTNFPIVDGAPVQVVRPPERVTVGMLDFTHLPEENREAAFIQWSRKRTMETFDLPAGELFRADLVRLAPDRHVIFFTLHHIICDGWSLAVLARETMVLYSAFSKDKPSPLPELPLQYGDYAAWQRSRLQGEAIDRQLAFWSTRLANAPAFTQLPFDRPRPPDRSYRGARIGLSLDGRLVARLRLLCQREHSTFFMVLISTLAVLFHRYSGETDIVIGSPVANRGFREVEPLIGLFINTVAFRCDLSNDPTFKELLGRVRTDAIEAFNNQDVPFESVLNTLGIRREKNRSPLFQVMLAMQPPRAASVVAELGVDPAVLTPRGSKFDLTLVSWEGEDGAVSGIVEYATDLFEAATIDRLIAHWIALLEGIAENADQRISALPMLREEERRQVVLEWNATQAPYHAACIHELFEEQASRTPEAVALICDQERISYRDLDGRANRLAWHLRKLGVGPDTIVGLCLPRSPNLVVGLLGIFKAGGAYLPLDPSYPRDRLEYMLADAKPRLVLTEKTLFDALPAGAAPILQLDAEWPAIASQPADAPTVPTVPDNLAYVLYTSGSTGQPKGVMGTHRVVVNRLQWDVTANSSDDIYAHKTTPNFIDALWEIFMPLIRGQMTVIIPEAVTRDPSRLVDLLSRHNATRIVLVPSLLRSCLDVAGDLAQRLPKLRHWACSGEPLSPALAAAFRKRLPDAELFNIYGTSEFWDATWFQVREDLDRFNVAIGMPIANMRALVLDAALEPVPINVTGELYIGGDGLARGYLNRPTLSAERFIADPFGNGGRLYRTGDLARRTTDGNLEFVGRRDHQIKLRGHRIELPEIESVLGGYPQLRAVAVQLRNDLPSGDPGLVAYVVADPETTERGLRTYLEGKLPAHMIPSHFVFLQELPLAPNGKLNRAALPAPGPRQEVARRRVAPKSEIEKLIAGTWSDVLRVPDIGIDDNFFEHGGDSLMLVRIHAAISARMQREIPVTAMFRYPTVRALSSYLAEGQRKNILLQSTSRGEARKKFFARRSAAYSPSDAGS